MSKPTPALASIARAATFLIAFSAVLLAGCSTTRVIDSEVTAFQTWQAAPPGPGTAYRFERLPSQQAKSAQQDAIEAAARPALAKVGLVPSDTTPRYSVQVLLSTKLVQQVFSDPFGYGPYGGYGRFGHYGPYRHGRFGGYGSFGFGGFRGASVGLYYPGGFYDSPSFRHELAVLMRDLSTQQVAFETHAVHDGPWNDTLNLLPALLDAALAGFPQPPAGPRQVNVTLQKTPPAP